MSSTTGEHINELEERRRRRQQRNAAQPGPAKPPRSANTAPEARDLLRDLITNGSRPDEGGAAPSRRRKFQSDGGQRERFDRRRRANANRRLVETAKGSTSSFGASKPAPRPSPRRPNARLAEVAPSVPPTFRPTRQPGTQRDGEPAVVPSKPLRAAVESKRRAAWAAAAAIVLIAGVVLALSLDSAGGRRTATTHSAPILATAAGLASAVRITISTVDRELEALTHRATGQVHPGRRVIKRARVRPRRHHARTTQATSATQSQPVHVASPPTTSSQTPTSTQQPSASSGRSSAGGASSSSGSAHPAGPTNASPLGGIGSCVSGCT